MTNLTIYEKFEDGKGVQFDSDKYTLKIACCDCGLVHYIGIEVIEGTIIGVGFIRDNRATAQLRHHNYGNLQNNEDKSKYKLIREQ